MKRMRRAAALALSIAMLGTMTACQADTETKGNEKAAEEQTAGGNTGGTGNGTAAGNGSGGGQEAAGNGTGNAKDGKKLDVVIMVASGDATDGSQQIEGLLKEKFPQYNIISKNWDQATAETIVKTAAAGGESVDVVKYWANQMNNFITADMAMDLTADMDEEWRSTFVDKALEVGTYDGKLYNIPYNFAYPVILVNEELCKEAGIGIPVEWTWEEFTKACQQVKDQTGKYGVVTCSTWSNWFIRNGLLQVWDDKGQQEKFNAGEIPFTDEKVKKVFDDVTALFNSGLAYPGEGSLALSKDQAMAAFAQGEAAFLTMINTTAIKSMEQIGLEHVAVAEWPSMGTGLKSILGSCNGYFIPSSCKNKEAALDVIKYLTGIEYSTIRANNGQVVAQKVESDLDLTDYQRSMDQVVSSEIVNVSSEISNYIMEKTPANYLYYGDEVLKELEELRKAAVK